MSTTAKEARRIIQSTLMVASDGEIGPKTRAAFESLAAAPADSPWPPLTVGPSDVFNAFIPWILDREGRFLENDPSDPGGMTHYGIDQRSHPGVDIRNLTEAQAIAIYWQEWQADGCESLPSPYAEVFFNCAVNMGLGRAKDFHVSAQGNPGAFLNFQEAKYRSLAHGTMAKYLNGWLSRCKLLRQRFGIA